MDWITSFFSWLFGKSADSKTVAKVQAATVKLCGFLPMAETVAKLVAVGNPSVDLAATIATKICAAVTPVKVGLISTVPTVDGVPIEGEFVK